MAMEFTHLRFAVDLAPNLNVGDMTAYLSGSIYPDSRYVTRIPRNLTHGPDSPHNPFASDLDDFQKGWATHLLYDEKSLQKYKDLSPWPERKIVGFGEEWIFVTAEKLIEDLVSYDEKKIYCR